MSAIGWALRWAGLGLSVRYWEWRTHAATATLTNYCRAVPPDGTLGSKSAGPPQCQLQQHRSSWTSFEVPGLSREVVSPGNSMKFKERAQIPLWMELEGGVPGLGDFLNRKVCVFVGGEFVVWLMLKKISYIVLHITKRPKACKTLNLKNKSRGSNRSIPRIKIPVIEALWVLY